MVARLGAAGRTFRRRRWLSTLSAQITAVKRKGADAEDISLTRDYVHSVCDAEGVFAQRGDWRAIATTKRRVGLTRADPPATT